MTENELKRCPFCGGESKVHKSGSKFTHWYNVYCSQCDVQNQQRQTASDAIAAWNTRPIDAHQSALLAKAVAALENAWEALECWGAQAAKLPEQKEQLTQDIEQIKTALAEITKGD